MTQQPLLARLLLPFFLVYVGQVPAQGKRPQERPPKAKLEWRLPSQGYVDYSADTKRFDTSLERTQLHGEPRPAFGFYTHEIKNGTTLVYRNPDALDLMHIIALSLEGGAPKTGKKTKVERRILNCQRIGEVLVEGIITTEDASDLSQVKQTGELTLSSSGVRRAGLANTKLSFERVVDSLAGRVISFDAKYRGQLRLGGGRREEFDIHEEWVLIAVRKPRYQGFQSEVDKAIQTGCKNLMRGILDGTVGDPGSRMGNRRDRSYDAGELALAILTILKGNPVRNDPNVLEALDDLRSRELIDSYSLGVGLMALEAFYTPANERQQIIDGLIPGPQPRRPSPEDKELMTMWAKQLMANRDTRVNKGYKLRFNYVSWARYDNSVTQYAALGLYSAALSGVKLSPMTWVGLSQHYLDDVGDPEGKGISLMLPSYRNVADKRKGGKTTAAQQRIKPRGFYYVKRVPPANSPNGTNARRRPAMPARGMVMPTTGSMTCAGISGMSICRAMLGKGRGNRRAQRRLEKMTRAAFAWLYKNYDVRNNPGRNRTQFYYYLYGLERACELSGVARIHDKDWYFEGAMQLIRKQNRNGSWGNVVNTCFAVLFLKKAVAPAITGR